MIALPPSAESLPERLLEMSWSAGVLVLIVLTAQMLFGRWLTPRWRYALWGVVVVRLLLPVVPGSAVSVGNLWSNADRVPAPTAAPKPDTTGGWVVGTLAPRAAIPFTDAAGDDAAVLHRDASPPVRRGFNGWLLVWAAGASVVLGRGGWLHLRLMRRVRRDAQDASESTAQRFAQRCRAWGIRRPVALRITDAVSTPTLCGLRRPAVLLPSKVADTFSDDELRHIFDHELAHLRRGDLAANWGLLLLTAIHWFNPLIWFAFHRLRLDREPARDAMVLAQRDTPPHPRAYGHTLLRVLELLQDTAHPYAGTRPTNAPAAVTLSMSVAPRHARRRFRHLARHRAAGVLPRVLGVLLLTALVAVGCTAPPQKDAATPTPAADIEPATEPPETQSQEEAVNAAARAKLAEPIDIDLSMARLDVAFELIRQDNGILLFVNWPTLEDEGFSREMPVSLTLSDVPAEKALQLILQQVSAHLSAELGFTVRDGVVVVSTRADTRAATDLRVYDIRDLLAPFIRFNLPLFRADGLVVEEQEPIDPEVIADREQKRTQAIEDISMLIQETVGRFDDWEINGGPDSVRELNENLIIKTTPDHHRQITKILEQLREGTVQQISIESRLLMVPPDALIRAGLMADLIPIEAQAPEEARTAWRVITDLEFNLLVETALAHRKAVSLTAPRITVFNGQTGYVTNARQRAFVQDAEILPGENGFDVTIAQVQDEWTLIAKAGLVTGRDDIALELDGRMILVDEDFEERPVPGLEDHPRRDELLGDFRVDGVASVDGKVVIQTPRVQAWRARLKTTMPDRGTLMIVGPELKNALTFTDPPRPDAGPRSPVLLISPTRIDPQTKELFPGLTEQLLSE